MFTRTLFWGVAALFLVSFSNAEQTNQEDAYGCPYNSTEVVASCTRGCYSVVILGQAFSLSDSELQEATRRLQNYCDSQSLVRTSVNAPSIL